MVGRHGCQRNWFHTFEIKTSDKFPKAELGVVCLVEHVHDFGFITWCLVKHANTERELEALMRSCHEAKLRLSSEQLNLSLAGKRSA